MFLPMLPRLTLLLTVVTVLLAGCGAVPGVAPPTPFMAARAASNVTVTSTTVSPAAQPAPSATPTATEAPIQTPTPTATATALPSPTPNTAQTATPTPLATAVPTPLAAIPQGWVLYQDSRLGYSLATPSSWLKFDLWGDGLESLVTLLGPNAAQSLSGLQTFLDSPEGESMGVLVVEPDISQMFSRTPLPAIANVFVVTVGEDITAEELLSLVQASAGLFGAVTVNESWVSVINDLPAVEVLATADLTAIGMPVQAAVRQVGLVVNGKLYTLTLLARADLASRKQAVFDQLVGTFRPG